MTPPSSPTRPGGLFAPTSAGRAAAVLGAVWGAALLSRPRSVLRAVGADPDLPGAVPAARVLGARHLAQSAALTARPADLTGPAVLTEGLHVASMLALAVIAPKYRAPALASAVVATVLGMGALASWRVWRSVG